MSCVSIGCVKLNNLHNPIWLVNPSCKTQFASRKPEKGKQIAANKSSGFIMVKLTANWNEWKRSLLSDLFLLSNCTQSLLLLLLLLAILMVITRSLFVCVNIYHSTQFHTKFSFVLIKHTHTHIEKAAVKRLNLIPFQQLATFFSLKIRIWLYSRRRCCCYVIRGDAVHVVHLFEISNYNYNYNYYYHYYYYY